MAGSSKTTTDHDEIRKWAEARGGKPATVKRTESKDDVGVLRIDFPGYGRDDSLEEISWAEFFAKFDEKQLAFLYQDKTSSGEESRFFKLVSRETAEDKSHHAGSTSHKSEHKTDEKVSKSDDKSHKTEARSHKAEDKDDTSKTKAHKDETKSSRSSSKAPKASAKSHKE